MSCCSSSRYVAADAHALIVLGGAGWHQTGGCLRVPGNITPLQLAALLFRAEPIELAFAKLKHLLLSAEVRTMDRLRTVLG